MKQTFSDRYYEVVELSKNIANMSDSELKDFRLHAEEVLNEYNNFQLLVKRNCNSLYGASANKFFSLHDTDIAEDITISCKHFAVIVDIAINKFFTTWADNNKNLSKIQEFYPEINKLINFSEYTPDTKNDICCYGDTDSRYVRLDLIYSLMIDGNGNTKDIETLDYKQLSDFAVFLNKEFLSKIIKQTIDNDCEKRNARKGYLKMSHETTAIKSVFLTKKKYILTTVWNDGKLLDKPKLKYKGVELKRGSMSEKAKKILQVLINKYLLDGYSIEEMRNECLKIIKYIKTKKDKELVYLISSVSGVSDLAKNDDGVWYSKSNKTHIQMQIALSWCNFITDNNLTDIYKPPFDGQKMQYYYTTSDKYKVIGIPDDLNINDIKGLPDVDWNRMITQVLLKPLCNYILDKDSIDEKDVEAFLLGMKIWKF